MGFHLSHWSLCVLPFIVRIAAIAFYGEELPTDWIVSITFPGRIQSDRWGLQIPPGVRTSVCWASHGEMESVGLKRKLLFHRWGEMFKCFRAAAGKKERKLKLELHLTADFKMENKDWGSDIWELIQFLCYYHVNVTISPETSFHPVSSVFVDQKLNNLHPKANLKENWSYSLNNHKSNFLPN